MVADTNVNPAILRREFVKSLIGTEGYEGILHYGHHPQYGDKDCFFERVELDDVLDCFDNAVLRLESNN